MAPSISPKLALIKGAFWTIGTRWAIKCVGFLNTVIMARLVLPADYGVVAMATLVVGLFQAFMDLGAETALLRKKEVSRDEIDSAWTLRLMQSLAVCTLMVVAAPLAAAYFKEPRVQLVLWMLAACIVLEGLNNIGLALAQKQFQFSLIFRVNVISKVLSVVVTIVAGLLLGDYRALVLGLAAGYVGGLVLSYWLHPYRPRWNTSKIGEIWAVTKWLMLASMGNFLLRRSDELVAARISNTADYGTYHVGGDLGRLPVSELGPAMTRAFLPVLSTMQGQRQRVNAAVIKTLAAINAITLPVGLGVAAVAVPLTRLILGEQWLAAAPFVALFAVVASVQFAISPLNTLLVLDGHTKVQSTVVWLEFAFFAVAAVLLVPHLNLMGLVWARLLGSGLIACVTAGYTRKHCDLSMRAVAGALWRPTVGSIAMYGAVSHFSGLMAGDGVLELAASVLLGVVSYTAWMLVSWRLVGRPEGLESTVLDALRARRMPRTH